MPRNLRDIVIHCNLKLTSSGGAVTREKRHPRVYDTDEATFATTLDDLLAETPPGGSIELENNKVLTTVEVLDDGGTPLDPVVVPYRIFDLDDTSWETARLFALSLVDAAPAPPSNLAVEPTAPDQLTLTWESSNTTAEETIIERSTDSGSTYSLLAEVDRGVETYVDDDLAIGTYFYRIYERNQAGSSDFSTPASFTLVSPAPTAPSSLIATVIGFTQIDLTWTDNANNETSYRVYRSTDGGLTYSRIALIAAGSTSYSVTGLTASTQYYFYVTAYNSSGEPASNIVSPTTTALPAPNAPTNLIADGSSPYQISLAWTDNSNSESGFKIERSDNGTTGWVQIATVGANVTGYINTSLPAATTYYYQVRAYNSVGNSTYSNVASDTTQTVASTNVAPSTPASFAGTVISDTQIDFTWANVSNTLTFVILRSEDGGESYREACRMGPGVTSYSDRNLEPNTIYSYKIKALNGGGFSAASTEIEKTTLAKIHTAIPADPSGLTVLPYDEFSLSLEWYDDTCTDEDAVLIEESANGTTGWTQIASLTPGVTQYKRSGLTANTTRHYKIRTSNSFGNSGYCTPASGTTLSAGQVYSPTGHNPTAIWTPQWQKRWTDAKADFEANGAVSDRARQYSQLKTVADAAINNSLSQGQYQVIMYQITGTLSYATAALAHIGTASAPSGFGYWLGLEGAVTGVSTAAITPNKNYDSPDGLTDLVNTDLPTSTYDIWKPGGRVYWKTGANVNDQLPGSWIETFTASPNHQIRFYEPLAADPQVGDTFYLIPRFKDGGYNNFDSVRGGWTDFAWMGTWLWPAMTTKQKLQYRLVLEWLCDFGLANDVPYVSGGAVTTDSDQTTVHALQILAVEAGIYPDPGNFPRLGQWIDGQYDPVVGKGYIRTGGFTPVAVDADDITYGITAPLGSIVDISRLRNTLLTYSYIARGGTWMESSEYNSGTYQYVCLGIEMIRTASGVDYLSEFRPLHEQMAMGLVHGMTPDMLDLAHWGDEGAPHAIKTPGIVSGLALIAGANRGNAAGKALRQTMLDLYNSSSAQQALYANAYTMGDPIQGTTARSANATNLLSRGTGHFYARDGWGTDNSFLYAWMESQDTVQHYHFSFGDVQLYRKGEWVLSHPIGYNTANQQGEMKNSMTFAGQSAAMETRGIDKAEQGADYAYCVGTTSGNKYVNTNPNNIPQSFLYEATKSLFWLPSGLGASDTLLAFDRTLAANPFNLDRLSKYTGFKQILCAVNDVSPSADHFVMRLTVYTVSNTNNAYKNYVLTWTSGALVGESQLCSSYTGSTHTIYFPSSFSQAPQNGDTFTLTLVSGDTGRLYQSYALKECFEHIYHAKAAPTVNANDVTWQTNGNQNCRWQHLLPATRLRDVRVEDNASVYPGASFATTELGYQIRIAPTDRFPSGTLPVEDFFFNIFQAADGSLPTNTLIENVGGEAKGALVTRSGEDDAFVFFSTRSYARLHRSGFTFIVTPTTATSKVFLCDLDPRKTWTYTVNGGGSQSLTVTEAGIGEIPLSGATAKTIVMSAS